MPGNRLPRKILEWEAEGTRRRERPKERWIDEERRSMTNHGLREEDTRDRDRWRNLVLGEGKPLWSGQTLDDDELRCAVSIVLMARFGFKWVKS
jgi:hypothetical protein